MKGKFRRIDQYNIEIRYSVDFFLFYTTSISSYNTEYNSNKQQKKQLKFYQCEHVKDGIEEIEGAKNKKKLNPVTVDTTREEKDSVEESDNFVTGNTIQ